jgi:hypothetical protein
VREALFDEFAIGFAGARARWDGEGLESAAKVVVTSLAGFDSDDSVGSLTSSDSALESVVTGMAGFESGGDLFARRPGPKTAMPAAFRHPAAASRRTSVAF